MTALQRLLKAAFAGAPVTDAPDTEVSGLLSADRRTHCLDSRTLNSIYYPCRQDFHPDARQTGRAAPGYHPPGYHAYYALRPEEMDLMRQVRESMARDTDGSLVQRIQGWLQCFDHTLGLQPPAP